MFNKSAKYYDAIYQGMGKDYTAESARLLALIEEHRGPGAKDLLDVACGTGIHIETLGKHYRVEGLDLDETMLVEARRKFPAVPFHHGDMCTFNLGRTFDVITCLFSSIGYVRTPSRLDQAVNNMGRHLAAGGVLLVEPWFSPESWNTGKLHALLVDQPELKISRMSLSGRKGNLSTVTFHYLVATPGGVEHLIERHTLGLFTREQYLRAFDKAGMQVILDQHGLDGRGLLIGKKEGL